MIEDREWVARALEGSQEAYGELVRRYERPVYGLIVRMVRDPAKAEELAQETFIKAFTRLATYDPAKKFSSWLFKIAHNTTIDLLRRREPDTVSLEPAAEGETGLAERLADPEARAPDGRLEQADLAAALEAAVARLRPEYREVILLRFVEGLAYEEIASIAALPLGTVKTFIHRARKQMAEALTEAGWGMKPASPSSRRAG